MVTTRSKKAEEKKVQTVKEEQNFKKQPGDEQEQEAEREQKVEENQEQNNPQELRTYRGNCHCGAFVYEAELPEIKSAMECNCSICHKKGYLWVDAQAKYEVVKGTDDTLARYTSGPKKLVHMVGTIDTLTIAERHDADGFTVLPYVCHAGHVGIHRGGASTSERMLNNPISVSKKRGTDEKTQQARAIQGIDTRGLEKQPYVSRWIRAT
jgi:hypothetical protein